MCADQAAVPTSLVTPPPIGREAFFMTSNDGYKLRCVGKNLSWAVGAKSRLFAGTYCTYDMYLKAVETLKNRGSGWEHQEGWKMGKECHPEECYKIQPCRRLSLFSLYNSTTKMCRKTVLGPKHDEPLSYLSILPNPPSVSFVFLDCFYSSERPNQ